MKHFTKSLAAIGAAIVLSAAALAQAQTPPPPPCTQDAKFRDFDFWVGYWEVTPWAGGQIAGHNKIEPVEGGCALSESWINTSGGTGRSINYYNPNTGNWRQVWVAGGYSIDIEGGINADGAMELEGTIFYYAQKNSVPFKGIWTPQPDGSVRQHFLQWNAETEEWGTWFDGRYVRTAENK